MPIQITAKKQCDSASDEVKIGEAVMSLRRAFRIAGAPRAKAGREAQSALLRSKDSTQDFSNPYYWAAFTLTGQWR